MSERLNLDRSKKIRMEWEKPDKQGDHYEAGRSSADTNVKNA